jgi:hypothetical protein
MAGERERRIGENEAIFRAANERMADWEERDRVEALELYFVSAPIRLARRRSGYAAPTTRGCAVIRPTS